MEQSKDVIAPLWLLGNASFAEMDKTGWERYQKRSLLIPGRPHCPLDEDEEFEEFEDFDGFEFFDDEEGGGEFFFIDDEF